MQIAQTLLSNYYAVIWCVASLLAAVIYSKHLFRIFHWSFALACSYTVFNSVLHIFQLSIFNLYNPKVSLTILLHFHEALLTFVAALFIMEKVTVKDKWMMWVCLTNIVLTICLMPIHTQYNWLIGLSVNPSMNGAIIAITLPFLLLLNDLRLTIVAATFGIFLLFRNGTTTPILAFGMSLFAPSFFSKERHKALAVFFILLTCVWASGIYGFNLGHLHGRSGWYLNYFRYWLNNFNPVFGAGMGSFYIWGPLIEYANGAREVFAIWMHSDVLQCLFELGIAGLVLWGVAITHIIYSLKDNTLWLMAGTAWLVTSAMYYPIHFPIQLWLGLMIANVAIKKRLC